MAMQPPKPWPADLIPADGDWGMCAGKVWYRAAPSTRAMADLEGWMHQTIRARRTAERQPFDSELDEIRRRWDFMVARIQLSQRLNFGC